jgi:5-methylcytosine-specific restriction enzyme A
MMPAAEPHRPWRGWYNSKEWFQLRHAVLQRDSVEVDGRRVPKCRQTGVLLVGKAPAANSPVVDHIKPHRGDRRLFFSLANLQVVSKRYHDSTKASHERSRNVAVGADGWPI